jgi:hypothetical protein
MKCPKCGKPIKENTDGNLKYCQGHWVGENVTTKGLEYENDRY